MHGGHRNMSSTPSVTRYRERLLENAKNIVNLGNLKSNRKEVYY
jgi:hypothetical protein